MPDVEDSAAGAEVVKARIMEELERHPFRPAWWLRGRHGQTAFSHAFRRQAPPPTRQERLSTPDGDFLDLHLQEGEPDKPLVLMLHGLEGSARSHYIVGLHHAFRALRWSSAVMEFRSCGDEFNRGRRLYHSGETTDLALAVAWALERKVDRIYLVGFSLGGNVLAKWLGDLGDAVPEAVRAAAVVSVPFDLAASAPYFERTLGGLYARRFLRTLIPKAIEKERQFPGSMDVEKIRNSRTFRAFDTHATAALHGFRDAEDYWAQSSSGPVLDRIRRPTLLVSAVDDPFSPPQSLPRAAAQLSPWLYPQFPQRGGHVGFVCGASPFRTRYWSEEHVVRFFQIHDRLIADRTEKSTY